MFISHTGEREECLGRRHSCWDVHLLKAKLKRRATAQSQTDARDTQWASARRPGPGHERPWFHAAGKAPSRPPARMGIVVWRRPSVRLLSSSKASFVMTFLVGLEGSKQVKCEQASGVVVASVQKPSVWLLPLGWFSSTPPFFATQGGSPDSASGNELEPTASRAGSPRGGGLDYILHPEKTRLALGEAPSRLQGRTDGRTEAPGSRRRRLR